MYIYLIVAESLQFCSALVFLMGKGAGRGAQLFLRGGVSGMFEQQGFTSL